MPLKGVTKAIFLIDYILPETYSVIFKNISRSDHSIVYSYNISNGSHFGGLWQKDKRRRVDPIKDDSSYTVSGSGSGSGGAQSKIFINILYKTIHVKPGGTQGPTVRHNNSIYFSPTPSRREYATAYNESALNVLLFQFRHGTLKMKYIYISLYI